MSPQPNNPKKGYPQVERRRTQRKSIDEIIFSMRMMAASEFDSDIMTNALSIFNRLPESERRTFLRYSLNLINEVKISGLECAIPCQKVDDVEIDPQVISSEKSELEKIDYAERMRFRNSLFKTLFIMFWLTSIFVIVLITYLNPKYEEAPLHLIDTWEIIKQAIGIAGFE